MAGLTSEGLTIKTLPEIRASLENKLKARYGSTFNVDTNTPEGVMIGIFSDELSDAWEGVQGTYDAFFPKSSYGLNLDNVGDLVGVKRIPSSKSSVNLQFSGTVGTTVPENTVITVTGTNERFSTVSPLTLSSSIFSEVVISVSSVLDTTDYTVTIDGESVTYVSGVGATASSILDGLLTAINVSTLPINATKPTSTTLNINVTEVDSTLPLVVGARLSVNSISNLIGAEAQSSGGVLAPAGTLVTLLVPILGITSVTNLADAKAGRAEETDEEFRVRRYDSVNIVGASTFGAITSRLRNITGVERAFLIENDTASTDSEGRPPKSFESVIEGGDLDEIAETIWKYKPAGIETFGSITRTIFDQDDIPRTVNFSRPSEVYIHVIVKYSKYTEEAFQDSAVQAIKDAVVTYGNTINIGTDIIPQRFLGSIYNAVPSGLGRVVVEVAKSYDGVEIATTYQDSQLPISRKESAVFSSSLVTVVEV